MHGSYRRSPTVESLGQLTSLLRCVDCGGSLSPTDPRELEPSTAMTCVTCSASYPVIDGTVRMLGQGNATASAAATGHTSVVERRTAQSFAYEWRHFGQPRPEWRQNFLGYLQPHSSEWFVGKRVLDVGAGSGRHSRQAHELGAYVAAVDVGDAINVARANLPPEVLTVQAAAEALPFPDGSFDLVMSIGVLHHLADPVAALRSIVRCARPGGYVQIYMYWIPELRWHRLGLRAISAVRRVTVRLPHRVLHAGCYPLGAVLWPSVVIPHRLARRRPRLARLTRWLPLKTYADYPFGVLVNDQFDRFSAPIERRYTRADVRELLAAAGLQDINVRDHHGWVGCGVRADS